MISVTSLSSYLYCARKLFLEQVLRLAEAPKEAVVKGTIKHQAFDGINKIDENIVTGFKAIPNLNEIEESYKAVYAGILRKTIIKNKRLLKVVQLTPIQAFKETWPLLVQESSARAKIIHEFIQKSKLLGQELWDNLIPKIKSEHKIKSQNLNLVGVIDQLHIFENECVPFELKSGKAPMQGVWPNHMIQIGAYAILLEEEKMTVKKGIIRYVDTNESRLVVMNPFLRQEVLDLSKKVADLLESSEIPNYCQNKKKCDSCGLKQACCNEKLLRERLAAVSS